MPGEGQAWNRASRAALSRGRCRAAVSHDNAEGELREKAINWPNAIMLIAFFGLMTLFGWFLDWGFARYNQYVFTAIVLAVMFGVAAVWDYRDKVSARRFEQLRDLDRR